MQWFKRQPCLLKIVVVGFVASMFLCVCAGLVVIIPQMDTTWKDEYMTQVAQREGMSRAYPVPMGVSIVADNDVEVTVLEFERDAWATIYEANMFNPEPHEGMEYVIVTVKVRSMVDPTKTVLVSGFHFRVVGERAAIYERLSVVLDKELDVELFGGGTVEGQIPFQVVQGEKDLVLIYDSGWDTEARYLSLGE